MASQHGNFTQSYSTPSASEHNDSMSQIPNQLIPSRIGRALAAKKNIKSVYASSGQIFGNSTTSIIQIPVGAGSGYLVPNSAYLQFNFVQSGATGNATWGFSGSFSSAYSTVNRIIISQGSSVLETIQNANYFVNNIVDPYCSSIASQNISAILNGGIGQNNYRNLAYAAGLAATDATANSVPSTTNFLATDFASAATAAVFTLPLVSGFLSGGNTNAMLPLHLLSSPINIQLDWNTALISFCGVPGTGTIPTGFSGSNLMLCYETVEPDNQYQLAVRQEIQGGRLYSIPYETVISLQTAGATSVSFNFSLNVSSLEAFFWGVVTTIGAGANGTKCFSSALGSTPTTDLTAVSRRMLYVDGNSVSSIFAYALSDASQLVEMIRSVSASVSGNEAPIPFQITGLANIWGTYRGCFYSCGYNLRNFTDSDLCFQGLPTSIAQLQVIDSNLLTTSNIYMFAVVQYIAVISADGAISLIR